MLKYRFARFEQQYRRDVSDALQPETALKLRAYAAKWTRGSALAEGLRDALVSRNSATTKYRYRVALFA